MGHRTRPDLVAVLLLLVLVLVLAACTGGESDAVSDRVMSVDASTSTSAEPDRGEVTNTTAEEDPTPLGGNGVVFDGAAGAADAEGAVRGLLGAINSGDILGALANIEPAERDLVADIYLTAIESSESTWPAFGGHEAIAELGTEVLPLSPLRTELHNDHLAWVETDEVEFYMAAPTEVAAAFFSTTPPWGPGSGFRRDEIAVRADDWSAVTYLLGPSSDVLPGLIVTRIDDRWYVSFGRTMLELLRLDAGYVTDFPVARTVPPAVAAGSPEAAVVDFLDALADDRLTDAAGLLVPGEAQAFADYPAMLERWLPGLLDVDIELDRGDLSVVRQDSGRAVVELERIDVSVLGLEHDEGVFDEQDELFSRSLSLADRCLTLDEDDKIWCDTLDNYATGFTSMYSDLGWEGLRLVTVESDDGWSVSIYESIAHYGLPIVSDPLFGLGFGSFTGPIEVGPLPQTLINETAKTMTLQEADVVAFEPVARGRFLTARIVSSTDGLELFVDPVHLDRECFITIWNTDMVTSDWSEEPEYYDDENCSNHFERPLEIPAGVELTVTVWGYGESFQAIVAELR